MWKVILVSPNEKQVDKELQLGIGYLASHLLKNNEDVEVDLLDTGIFSNDEIESTLNQEYNMAGFSVTSNLYNQAVDLAKKIKNRDNDVPIVFGGPHVSVMTGKLLEEPVIDFAVYGEGEITLHELVNQLKKKGGTDDRSGLHDINGLIFRDGDEVVVNPPRELIKDLDILPFPAYHLFPKKHYPNYHNVITSRGCPYSCVFCSSSKIWKRWRGRSVENVYEEIQLLLSNYGYKPISFQDSCFNVSVKRLDRMCDLFLENNLAIPWSIKGFRADIVNRELAKKLAKAGLSHVSIGIESANPEVLKTMGKGETIEDIERGIDILTSEGIDVRGQFMIGNPGDTLETTKESIAFAIESNLTSAIMGTAVPIPNTQLWNYVQEHGRFLVEPDCTRYGEVYPRILFETPDFNEKDRLEAMELARQAGILIGDRPDEKEQSLRITIRNYLVKSIFEFLPDKAAYRFYFMLRKIKRSLWKSKKPL